MTLFQRSAIALLLLCVGCSAQSNNATNSGDLDRRVERQIRAQFQVPEQVEIKMGGRSTSSDFPSYDKLVVTLSAGNKKQDLDFLISKDNKTLVRWEKIDLTVDPYAEVMKKIDLSGRPWKGNKDAKVVIVSYDDFQCPFCSRMHDTLFGEVFKQYGSSVKVVYKDFPLYQIHPWANHAAVDSHCLATQNNDAYWAFADYVHNHGREINGDQNAPKKLAEQFVIIDKITRDQGQKFNLNLDQLNACIKAQDDRAVRASAQEGESLGVQATPTVFINGYKIDGAVPPNVLQAAIDRALKDAGVTLPTATAKK